MFSARLAVSARPFVFGGARRFASTSPEPKPSNLPFWLGGAGIAGIAGYWYLSSSSGKEAVNAAKAASGQEVKSPLDPSKFVKFPLKKVESYNHNTAKFIFALPDGTAAQMPVASCVLLEPGNPDALKDDKGETVHRPYTPISPPDLKGEFVFLVKKYDTGVMSKFIHEMKPGDEIAVKGPLPKWKWKMNEFDDVGMIAGGSGITPMYQILNHALADPSNKTKFKLIFANVTEKDIVLKDDFDALKAKYPNNFDVIYTLDKPPSGWKGAVGYVNADLVKKTFAPSTVGDKVKIFVCGPPGQVNALAGPKASIVKQGELKGTLKELGYNENQVYKF